MLRSKTKYVLGIMTIALLSLMVGTGNFSSAQTDGFSCENVSSIPIAECEAVLDLYRDTQGLTWNVTDGTITPGCVGATARCSDGTCSNSANRRGTCSHHGGVSEWNPQVRQNTPCDWLGVTCSDGNVISLDVNIHEMFFNTRVAGQLPESLVNLTEVVVFSYDRSALCEPASQNFQNWLDNIAVVDRTGVTCSGSSEVPIIIPTQAIEPTPQVLPIATALPSPAEAPSVAPVQVPASGGILANRSTLPLAIFGISVLALMIVAAIRAKARP